MCTILGLILFYTVVTDLHADETQPTDEDGCTNICITEVSATERPISASERKDEIDMYENTQTHPGKTTVLHQVHREEKGGVCVKKRTKYKGTLHLCHRTCTQTHILRLLHSVT